MTLTELVALLGKSKKILIPAVVVLLLVLVGLQLAYRQRLPKVKLPASSIGGEAVPTSIRVRGRFSLPRWAAVYQIIEGGVPLTKGWAEAVGVKFGFTSSPQSSTLEEAKSFIWGEKEKWLSLGEEGGRNYLRYGLDLLKNPSLLGKKSKPLPSEKEAVGEVRQLLLSGGLNTASRLILFESSWVTMDGQMWAASSEEGEADALKLIMGEKLEDLPIFIPGSEALGSLVAYVGRGGKVLKVSYLWSEVEYHLFDHYPLGDLQQAVFAGGVIEVVGQGMTAELVELRSLTIDNVSLGYLADFTSGFTLPAFIYKGSGLNDRGKLVWATVIAPAIPSQWLQ